MFLKNIIKILKGRMLYFYLFYLILTLLVSGNSFFWDTIQLGSRHAHFYYNNHLKLIFLPDTIDSGHIPAFGYCLAIAWKILGKNLFISHLFMLPFLWGIVFQSERLFNFYFQKNKYLPLILFLADPTLLAQSILVSPDIPLVFFMLMIINGILKNKPSLKLLAVSGLALVSMRGWMLAALLFLFDVIYSVFQQKNNPRKLLRNLLYYLPGGMIAFVFLFLHFKVKGWIGHHENSPWAPSFELAGFKELLKNLLITFWRLIDFGRITWWIVFLIYFPVLLKKFKSDQKLKFLIILAGLFIFIFPVYMIAHTGLAQHRYFLPTYLIFSLVILYLVHLKEKMRRLFPILFILLLCGNFIIYPDKLAQGWDSSLAHIPYYTLRNEAIRFMKKNNYPIYQTKSWFPNLSSLKFTDLNQDTTSFSNAKLASNHYCLYSNIFNDVTDSEYDEIMTNWKCIYKEKKAGVKIILFKNPDFEE